MLRRDSNNFLNDIVEYGVFHHIRKSSTNLIATTNDAYPDADYFSSIKNLYSEDDLVDWFNEHLSLFVNLLPRNNVNFLLASGGVDSSALAALIYNNNNTEIIHSAYVNHDQNDIEKLNSLTNKYSFKTNIFHLSEDEYLSGSRLLWKNRISQNTYSPTLSYCLSKIEFSEKSTLITGSGPDELFYGMEKYPFSLFESLKDLEITKALKQIDTPYNLESYKKVLSVEGLEILTNILNERNTLYKRISEIVESILEAQRILAWCTVTNQHVNLFDTIASIHGVRHLSPFLNKELVDIALSIPINKLIDIKRNNQNVEIGKSHLKRYLLKFFDKDHVYSKKIGFHAPVSKFIHSKIYRNEFNFNYEYFPSIFDKDKLIKKVKYDLDKGIDLQGDYFLYSILNIYNLVKKEF